MVGWMPSSMHGGMMIGAIGWGACTSHGSLPSLTSLMTMFSARIGSDLMGRTTAFNATLVLTAVFGILASLSASFPLLCGSLFLLGSAVGVSNQAYSISRNHVFITLP